MATAATTPRPAWDAHRSPRLVGTITQQSFAMSSARAPARQLMPNAAWHLYTARCPKCNPQSAQG
eukprot:4433574-Alexandrium_andersonii.AAC.1